MRPIADEDDQLLRLENLIPSPDAGPEAAYARRVLPRLKQSIDSGQRRFNCSVAD